MPTETTTPPAAQQRAGAGPDATTANAGAPGTARPSPGTPRRRTNWYGAFWRWHFYGSVIVIPVLLALSISGLVYLFRAQVDDLTHPGVLTVSVPAGAERMPLSAQEAVVREAFPDRPILSLVDQLGERATVFVTERPDGVRASVYVDPYRGAVTGELTADELLSDWAERVHGDLLIGDQGLGDRIVELGASWSIVLTVTGVLIFVLGRRARRGALRARSRGARLRAMHAVVGLPVGLGLLMLVVSGLPWTGVWGGIAQQVASSGGGSLWNEDPGAASTIGEHLEHSSGTSEPAGWAIGMGPAGHSSGAAGTPVSIDAAVAAAQAAGAPGPYQVLYPTDAAGTFSVVGSQWKNNGNPAESQVHLELTVHVDQYSGDVVGTYGYDDYSATAQVVSQGVAVHEGRRFGPVNTVLTTLFCLAVIFMCVSAPIMWWTRRGTATGLAAPRAKLPVWGNRMLLVALVALGVFLPLFGLSLVVILAFDHLVVRRVPRLRRLFGTV